MFYTVLQTSRCYAYTKSLSHIQTEIKSLRKFKPDLTIKEIGKFHFLFGILIWFGIGFLLYVLFQNFVKVSFVLSPFFSGFENTKSIEDLSFQTHLFLALVANSLAFSFTAYVWMNKVFHDNFRIRRLIRISQTNSFFIIGLMAYMLFRFFTILMTFNITQLHFDLIAHFGITIFSVPLFIFLYNWMFISKAFRSTVPLLISLVVWIIYGLLLAMIIT